MAAPTRGPWRADEMHPSDEYGKITLRGYRGAHVADVWNGGTRDPLVAAENAQLICALVNAHASLVDVLSRTRSVMLEQRDENGERIAEANHELYHELGTLLDDLKGGK